MATIDELLMADGVAHPAEVQFRGELAQLLEADLGIELVEDERRRRRALGRGRRAATRRTPSTVDHPFFKPFEFHYSRRPRDASRSQIEADLALIDRALACSPSSARRAPASSRARRPSPSSPAPSPFLDGHVYVRMPEARREATSSLVLGDLHGCYSVLKAALMQSNFFEKVDAYRKDPKTQPDPAARPARRLHRSRALQLNGVLRTVMQLFVTAPDHVIVLRGNHEYYVEVKGNDVRRREAGRGDQHAQAARADRRLPALPRRSSRTMPNMLLFDRFLFVHGGIPKDRLVKERWKDLSSLNDPDIRFQMMWSDPSTADVIPADLQDKARASRSAACSSGRSCSASAAHTMVRGHEKVIDGLHGVLRRRRARAAHHAVLGGRHGQRRPAGGEHLPRGDADGAHDRRQAAAEAARTHHAVGAGLASYNDPSATRSSRCAPEIPQRA